MARAGEHGSKINKPWGESSPYDFVVGSGRNLARVQVKSTFRKSKNGYLCAVKNRNGVYDADAF
jgi:hypothetical protein